MFECTDCGAEYTSASAVLYCECGKDELKKLDPWQEED